MSRIKKFLMGITNMLAPGMLVEDDKRRWRDNIKKRKDHDGRVADDESE